MDGDGNIAIPASSNPQQNLVMAIPRFVINQNSTAATVILTFPDGKKDSRQFPVGTTAKQIKALLEREFGKPEKPPAKSAKPEDGEENPENAENDGEEKPETAAKKATKKAKSAKPEDGLLDEGDADDAPKK